MPWLSFCISTYKRSGFLQEQLNRISKQTFTDFEVIVSDNDPEKSAAAVVQQFDERFRYFPNIENLGMIRSFNKSIERSNSEYILMITDDDFIENNDMVREFYDISKAHPGYGIYINCLRVNKADGEIEVCDSDNFAYQLLNPSITTAFLWSDSILKSDIVKEINGIPEYGSPHLVDHALLALCSKKTGGVFINKQAAAMNIHDSNYSRSNLSLYYKGCLGFYNVMFENFTVQQLSKKENALLKHLYNWGTVCVFSLRIEYLGQKRYDEIKTVQSLAKEVFNLPFMKQFALSFRIRYFLFNLKKFRKNLPYYFYLVRRLFKS